MEEYDDSQRFIPTPVGNSPKASQKGISRPVHPHACGELGIGVPPEIIEVGSSPRLWGTLYQISETRKEERFIPTPVGNSYAVGIFLRLTAVHPHACGELFISVV